MPLLVYTDEQVEKLRGMLPAAIKEHDETSIHQARVATRRLKATADVFVAVSAQSHRRDFVKILRRLRKHLGPARDLDVMLAHLQEIKVDRLKPAVDWMQNQLLAQQKLLRESENEFDVPRALARLGAWWGVRQDWREAGEGLHWLLSESLHLQLDRFVEHADAVSGRSAEPTTVMLDPHELRIAGKALRYSLELAVAGGHKLPGKVGRAFKQMQDALGIWHDYVVLNERMLKLMVETELSLHDSKTAGVALDLAKLAIRRSTIQLARFNKLWVQKGEILATAVRQAFPLTHPVPGEAAENFSELKTDPDLSATAAPAEDPPTPAGETSAG